MDWEPISSCLIIGKQSQKALTRDFSISKNDPIEGSKVVGVG